MDYDPTTITPGQREVLGQPPAGYQWFVGPDGRPSYRPIGGTPAAPVAPSAPQAPGFAAMPTTMQSYTPGQPVAGQPLPPGWNYATATPMPQRAMVPSTPDIATPGGYRLGMGANEPNYVVDPNNPNRMTATGSAPAVQPTQQPIASPYTAPQAAPQAATQAATPHQIGQSGIPFGGGQFTWTGEGWSDPRSGRSWDSYGNPIQRQAQQPQQQQYAAQASPAPYTAPAVPPQQSLAQSIVGALPDPNKVNVAAFGRLPTSAKEFVLAGYEAKGHDKQDVLEQFGKMLPSHAAGPQRGYVAQLGGR